MRKIILINTSACFTGRNGVPTFNPTELNYCYNRGCETLFFHPLFTHFQGDGFLAPPAEQEWLINPILALPRSWLRKKWGVRENKLLFGFASPGGAGLGQELIAGHMVRKD